MTQHQQESPVATSLHGYEPEQAVTGWVGWVVFAGILMFIAGSFNAIAGIVALFNDKYYLVPSQDLLVKVDYTVWGWVLLIYGIVQGLAGIGVLLGQTWARAVGVILAVFNIILNHGFLAAYPIWTTIIIALDVVVIYALTVHGRETRSMS